MKKSISEFEITGCFVRNRGSISFVGQQWNIDDPLVPHETAIFTCNIENPSEIVWDLSEIGTTTGLHGCPVHKPSEAWVFITDLSDVYAITDTNARWEEKVVENYPLYTLQAKCIDGFAYALGPNSIHRRDGRSSWSKLEKGLNTESVSFDDIDGFSGNEIYACGGYGELWRYDGDTWSKTQLPTSLRVKYVCCGGDGYVYVVTAAKNAILRGKGEVWEQIKKGKSKSQRLGAITWFGDRLLLLTTRTIYEVSKSDGFNPFDMGGCHVESFSQIVSHDGVLVVANSKQAAVYDGKNWNRII